MSPAVRRTCSSLTNSQNFRRRCARPSGKRAVSSMRHTVSEIHVASRRASNVRASRRPRKYGHGWNSPSPVQRRARKSRGRSGMSAPTGGRPRVTYRIPTATMRTPRCSTPRPAPRPTPQPAPRPAPAGARPQDAEGEAEDAAAQRGRAARRGPQRPGDGERRGGQEQVGDERGPPVDRGVPRERPGAPLPVARLDADRAVEPDDAGDHDQRPRRDEEGRRDDRRPAPREGGGQREAERRERQAEHHDPRVYDAGMRGGARAELADRLVDAGVVRLERSGDDPRRDERDLSGECGPHQEPRGRSTRHHCLPCPVYTVQYGIQMSKRADAPQLSRERILEAALAVTARDGMNAFSMRRLAQELDVWPMSVYRYFRDKDELLDAIAAHTAAAVPLGSDAASWREQLSDLLDGAREAMAHDPAGIGGSLARAFLTPEALRLSEAALAILEDAGLTKAGAASAWRALWSYTYGFAMFRIAPTPDET